MTDLRTLVDHARSHVESGGDFQAAAFYRLILSDTFPHKGGADRIAHGEACVYFAREAVKQGRLGTALDWYRQAVTADPVAAQYRVEMCMKVLRPMGMLREAQTEATRATKTHPNVPQTWRMLGGVERDLNNMEACIAAYDHRLTLEPGDPDAMLDRVTVALDVEDYDGARVLLDRVTQTERAGDAWHCLAMIAYREGRHQEAIELYDRALRVGVHDPATARWNKSLALHSIGRWREGWAEHEQRGLVKDNPGLAMAMRRFTAPIWAGEKGPGQIHVHAEQGMGDNLCLARYLPLLAERGFDVRLETYEPMVSLMARSFPDVRVMPRAIDYPSSLGVPDFDFHIPVLSLPHAFGTEVETVPWTGPYLVPDPELVAEYRRRVPVGAVGLCWSSGVREGGYLERYGRAKSMRLADMAWTFDNPFTAPNHFVSLQVGPERSELRDFPRILDLLPPKPTWDHTAALIACVDTTVTVDTAVAHLAGAMGKDVRLCMGRHASWHFLADVPGASWQHRSPWYPNTTVYRQSVAGGWGDVMARVAGDLRMKEAA